MATEGDILTTRTPNPAIIPWMSAEENRRLLRLAGLRQLFEGEHRAYYLDGGRTEFDFPEMRVGSGDRLVRPYKAYNLLRLMTQALTDLMVGEPPSISAVEPYDDVLQAALSRSLMPTTLFAAADECGWAGETYLEVTRDTGETFVQHVSAMELYPVGARRPNGQYPAYRRYATAIVAVSETSKSERTLLLETTYVAGAIERRVFQLGDPLGGDIARARVAQVPIDEWPARQADGSPLPDREATGLSGPSIVRVPNLSPVGVSDYGEGIIRSQDCLNAKETQLARVLALHADPKLAMPETQAGPNGDVGKAGVYFFRDADGIPRYITWDAQLAAATAERDNAALALCIEGRVAPALVGLKVGAVPESARKLRIEATTTVGALGRRASMWTAALQLLGSLVVQSETGATVAVSDIAVELKDGLPSDPIDLAEAISVYRAAGVMSRYRGLIQQGMTEDAAREELERLDEEGRAMSPTLLSEPNRTIEPLDVSGATTAADAAGESDV